MKKELLLFTATWCSPCKAFKPIFLEEDEKYPDVKFLMKDTDKDREETIRYKVRGVPSLVYLIDGEVRGFMNGMTGAEHIAAILRGK